MSAHERKWEQKKKLRKKNMAKENIVRFNIKQLENTGNVYISIESDDDEAHLPASRLSEMFTLV